MRKYIPSICIILFLFFMPTYSFSDIHMMPIMTFAHGGDNQEKSNDKCYAVSIPHWYFDKAVHYDEARGRTTVFKIGASADELLYTFDWFSDGIDMICGKLTDSQSGVSIVRLGPSYIAKNPQPDHIAIEFYLEGKLLKSYAATDLAKTPASYWPTVSHYKLFWGSSGYRWVPAVPDKEGHFIFETAVKDRIIEFDPLTGEIIKETPQTPELFKSRNR